MELRFLIRRVVVSFVILFLVACNKVSNKETPVILYPPGPRLLMAAGQGGVGRMDLWPLEQGKKVLPLLPVNSDAAIRSFSNYGRTFVINRFGQDSLYALGKGSSKIIAQLSLKKGANPQDVLMLDANTVLVTQRSESALVKWNLQTGQTQSLSLAAYAHSDGIPDMMMMAQVGDKIWISLQRTLDRIKPSDFSQVVIWEPISSRFESFRLKGTNPVTSFKRDPAGNVYIGSAGNIGAYSDLDGGIERLDARGGAADRFVIEEKELGGDVMDFEILDAKRGVALISRPNTELVAFNVETGKKEKTLLSSSGYDLVRILWDKKRGRLFVSDRTATGPKLHEFDTATLTEARQIPLLLPVWEMEIEEP